ncbi:hypothetical protein [Embleya sp. NBC_00896]|uniref:hypothetical protein n=1 Tax=Embleya sp. NBC_00896 TaxID=2975961 RepID=UPI00386FD4DA|nr:hypothetical protein OG928_24995 [Embleya sp. NBC_00896]
MHDPLWYLRAADYGPDPAPQPPGSGIRIAVYRVDAAGVHVVKEPEDHKGFTRAWPQVEPPCACPTTCPLKHGNS